jgi:hypothetical protein
MASPLRARDDDLANMLHMLSPVPVSPYTVMSAEGAWHPSHFDPNGFGTMLSMVRGHKAAIIAVPRDSRVRIPPHLNNHWDLVKRPDMDVYFIVIGRHQTL